MAQQDAADWRQNVEQNLVPFASSFGAEDKQAFDLLTYHHHLPGLCRERSLLTVDRVIPLHGQFEGVQVGVLANLPAGVDPIYIMSDNKAWLSYGQREALCCTSEEYLITQCDVNSYAEASAGCKDECKSDETTNATHTANNALDVELPNG